MRYKRDFHPTYVLGELRFRACSYNHLPSLLDPESYEWNLFDQDLLTRMNSRKYVSLSRERRLGIGASDVEPEVVDGKHTTPY